MWRTRDEGERWERVDGGLPEKWVSRVIASEHVDGRVYASFTGFREDDFRSYLFRSDDFGGTWHSIVGNLPVESVNVIREDPTGPGILYVGTDLGVFVSGDEGESWHSLSVNLPTTPVHDLVIHSRDPEMVIGTHGRSVFVLELGEVRSWLAGEGAGASPQRRPTDYAQTVRFPSGHD